MHFYKLWFIFLNLIWPGTFARTMSLSLRFSLTIYQLCFLLSWFLSEAALPGGGTDGPWQPHAYTLPV